jgi:Flp pilus assembly protein TadG
MVDIARKLRISVIAFWRDTDGVILPYVTLILVVLVGMSVLALDGARYMSLQTQLQNGADALALAGAAELDGTSGARTRATNAINNLVTNSTLYGSSGAQNVQVSSIRFLSALPASDNSPITSAYVAADAAHAHFVEVTATPVTLTTILPAAFFGGVNLVTSGAQAVAGFPNTVICNFPPVFICNPYETAGMTDDDATQALRTAMADPATLRKQIRQDNTKSGPGQFGFLIPPDGCTGASCLTDWIARTRPKACYSKAGVDLNTGVKTSVQAGFNVRFDIPGGGSLTPSAAYAPATNVRKGYVLNKNNSSWCNAMPAIATNDQQTDPNCQKNTSNAPAPQRPIALPKDSNLTDTSTNFIGNGTWDCASYWANGHTSAAPPGCTSSASTISRYQVYQYELANNLVGERSQYKQTLCTNPETGRPLCAGINVGVATPDRRNIIVAGINCLAHAAQITSGNTANNIPVAGFIKYFLTEPATKYLFGEFTGFATASDGIVVEDQIQLYR